MLQIPSCRRRLVSWVNDLINHLGPASGTDGLLPLAGNHRGDGVEVRATNAN